MHSLILLSLLGADQTGSVCLQRAQWEVPKGSQTSEAQAPAPVKKFSARLDERDAIDLSASATQVDGLALEGKHKLRIYADGKLRETFFLLFTGRSSRLTLRHDGFYGSWSLDPSKVSDCR